MVTPSPASAGFPGLPAYAELHCRTNFSFQVGASHAEELVARAHALGYSALAITDECSVAGLVRAHAEAKKLGLKLLAGSEFVLDGGDGRFRLIALAHNLNGWGALCEFITAGRRAAPKGEYRLGWQRRHRRSPARLRAHPGAGPAHPQSLSLWKHSVTDLTLGRRQFGSNFWLAAELLHGLDDDLWLTQLEEASAATGVPLVAAGDVVMHVRSRKVLHDVLTAVRLGTPVAQCGFGLQPNAEAHLRPRLRLAALYPPELLAHTTVVAERCSFSLDELRYQYPMETVLPGTTPAQTLRHHTEEGARVRYPQGVPAPVQKQIEHELALIAELKYEMYFLTVHDLVRFARGRGILCQGRGSAANSAVCYCLGVTEVDPARLSVLFERFISRERNEPPDIDVDFEHQRREEVIQYIYAKYGRDRAALTAVVICWRTAQRAARRGAGAGHGPGADRCAGQGALLVRRQRGRSQRVRDAGLDPDDLRVRQWLEIAAQLLNFPRHLSQHAGGFVLTQGLLTRLVPVENAAMPERSIIQWDKDDLDAVGLLKVDVLALGMLSAIRRCLALVSARRGVDFRMQDIPGDDPATWDMICAADTVGVFQIESRAQMSMLPRLKPRCFYDLVIEVAIVRPGPIQGGMVHPYLRRRQGLEPVEYPRRGAARGAGPHAGRAHLPGAGDADRHAGRGLQRRRGRQPAPLHGRVEAQGRRAQVLRAHRRRHGRARLHGRVRARHLPPDRRLRRIRLPRKPRRQLRAAGVGELLAQAPRARRLPRRHAQQPAPGLLHPQPARAGRPPPRHRSPPHRRHHQRLGLHAGGRRGVNEFEGGPGKWGRIPISSSRSHLDQPQAFTRNRALTPISSPPPHPKPKPDHTPPSAWASASSPPSPNPPPAASSPPASSTPSPPPKTSPCAPPSTPAISKPWPPPTR